jgi:hypothetical protein
VAELVKSVIGVDTYKDTHTAAMLDDRTGGVLALAARTRLAQPKTGPQGPALQMRLSACRALSRRPATPSAIAPAGHHQTRAGSGPRPRPEHARHDHHREPPQADRYQR